MTHYAIKHLTTFKYQTPVTESVMELRMRPSSDGTQRCLQFEVTVQPRARVFAYRDSLGNWIHHFNLPERHDQLALVARAQVDLDERPPLPSAIETGAWRAVEAWAEAGDEWDFRQPSQFTPWSDPLVAFADSLGPIVQRRTDPLTTVREVMEAIYRGFEYAPKSTRVDSPIGEALANRRGVCQDFTHIMLAVLRRLGLPCRYVSGYIAPRASGTDPRAATIATHAWVEVRLPELGWIGVDPTNNIEAGRRHIRVAIGRDYADVPPTRGIFKGRTSSTLSVSVEVIPVDAIPTVDPAVMEMSWALEPVDEGPRAERKTRQQQQQ